MEKNTVNQLKKIESGDLEPERKFRLVDGTATLARIAVYQKSAEKKFDGWVEWVDRAAKFMTKKGYTTGNAPIDAARGPVVMGLWLAIILFGLFGLWAVFAPLSSAAVARGVVIVESNKKQIQHLEGGIISEILVKDGDLVTQGQPLIKMNPTNAASRQEINISQLRLFRAEDARLLAERDGLKEIDFSSIDLLKNTADPEVQKIIASQKLFFESRRSALQGQLNVLGQKINESKDEIKGLQAQEAAADSQIKYLNEEIITVKSLVDTGQALRPRLLQLQRNESELRGNKGQYSSLIAKAKQTIAETELQMINAKTEFTNKVAGEMKEAESNISDLQEKLAASTDILNRVVITAPQDGKVTNLMFHTIGGVVQPGAVLMEIVPQHDKFIIEAQMSPQDIDVVHVGLPAEVRLAAYKSRRVPMIHGTVVYVSADRVVNNNNPNIQPYFVARIEVDEEMLNRLKDVTLYPGMPADVYIVTGKRTLMSYMFDPITDTFYKAFKEK